jgi:hypothetical protein
MRWLISTAAFFTPILLAFTIVGTMAGSGGTEPAIGTSALNELQTFVSDRDTLLSRYALARGEADSTVIPHLALERFDLRGVDADGNPWFRLALNRPGVSAGVLRRETPTTPVHVAGGVAPTRLLSLNRRWTYWEVIRAERAAKRP